MSFLRVAVRIAILVGVASPHVVSAQSNARLRDSLATFRRQQRDSINALRMQNGNGQPPATSQQRLLVQKEMAGGESRGTLAERARADSIAAEAMQRDAMERARRDSVERRSMFVRDSIANAERMRVEDAARIERMRLEAIEATRRDSITRADAERAEALRLEELRRKREYQYRGAGFYVGVAAGAVIPTGNLKNLGYNSGANVNVPFGWHPRQQLLGLRIDLGYAQFRGRDFSGDRPSGTPLLLTNTSPKVLSATGNVTLRLPLTPSKNLNFYALSGVGIYQFRSFGAKTALGAFFGNDVFSATPPEFQSVRNKLGAQFGAGLELGVGPVALYVESRVVNIFANRKDNVELDDFFGANRGQNLRWVPIMIGVNFR